MIRYSIFSIILGKLKFYDFVYDRLLNLGRVLPLADLICARATPPLIGFPLLMS